MRGENRYCYNEVLPFTALVTIECITIGGTTLYKAASSTLGMPNYYVFIVYTFLIGSLLILLSYPFFIHRSTKLPQLKFLIIFKIVLLGVIGYLAQILGYVGLFYSSPTLSSVASNLTPAFTFILAIMLRMEKLNIRRFSSQAKIIGTFVSVGGAILVTLYKGPRIPLSSSPPTLKSSIHEPLPSSQYNWILGGILLALQNLLMSIVYIFQAQIMKEYPVDLVVVLIYDLSALIVSAIVALTLARDLDDWKLNTGIVLTTVIYMGIFGGFFTAIVHTWGLRIKGPVYITMFKPLSIAIAVIMGVSFLGDNLHLGSIIGGVIISIGFYAVVWGKAKEEWSSDGIVNTLETPPSQTVPLLHSHESQDPTNI